MTNEQDFLAWLMTERQMSRRSAKDVVCRLKRIAAMLGSSDFTAESISHLNGLAAFGACSMFIKSQLRRSVALYLEYAGSTATSE